MSRLYTGLNTYNGKFTFKGVAEAFEIEYTESKKSIIY